MTTLRRSKINTALPVTHIGQNVVKRFSMSNPTHRRNLPPELTRSCQGNAELQCSVSDMPQISSNHEFVPDGIISCTRNGRINFASPLALELVARYFPEQTRKFIKLPEIIVEEFKNKSAGSIEITRPEHALNICWLTVKKVGQIVVLKEVRVHSQQEIFRSHGLSPRECEVAHWLIQGKTNDEISRFLGISRNTSRKHVERILSKLQVTTRTAIAAKLMAKPRL